MDPDIESRHFTNLITNYIIIYFQKNENNGVRDKYSAGVVSCCVCNASFPSIPELMSHYNFSHKLQCRLCQFVADSEKVLKLHYAVVHKENKHWFCPLTGCSYNCKRKHDLNRHMESHLTHRKKKWHCPLCQFVSFRQDLLRKHCLSVHNEKAAFHCDRKGCLYKTVNFTRLVNHLRIEHAAVSESTNKVGSH